MYAVLYTGLRHVDVDPRAGQVNEAYFEGLDALNNTFRTMLTSRRVARQAITRSGVRRSVDDVIVAMKATSPRGTNLIEISVTDRRADTARRLANAIADVFVEQVNDVQPTGNGETLVTIYERAREAS